MRNFDLEQNISDANASGRGLSSAPWNIYCNSFNSSKKVKCGQRGRSMIEMLGVLAIIGVLSVGGIAGYSKAMIKYRINKTIEQVSILSTNIRTFFANQKNYNYMEVSYDGVSDNDANYKVLKKAKLVPDDMWNTCNSNNCISSAFGRVELWAMPKNASDYDEEEAIVKNPSAFVIEFYDIPQEACVELATLDWGSAAGAGLIAVSAGTTDMDVWRTYLGCTGKVETNVVTACPNGSVVSIPMPIDKVVNVCNCTNNDCILTWKYY